MNIHSMRLDRPAAGKRHLSVLVIGSTYPRHEDDYAVPWLRESVARLRGRGHAVTVLAPSYEGLRSHTIDGTPVHRFRYAPRSWERLTHEQGAPNRIRKRIYQLLGVPYVAMGIRSAARLAGLLHFDVIHAHWPFPHGPIAAAARYAGGAPVVMNSHGAEFALARRKGWVRPLLRNALAGADRLICNSSHTAAEVKRLSGRDSVVIPYGSTVEARPTPLPRNEVPRILFTGRLIQRKGVEYLLRAMPAILARRPAILQITGSGDQRESLEALATSLDLGGSVEFHGFVSNERLDALYAGCDVYVNPSIVDDRGDTEGLGVGPIEAFAHGRPVVASDVGGIPDVVRHERTGLLVPEKDPEALAGAILRLLDDPDRAGFLARNASAYASEFFDWDRITDRIEDVYRAAIEGSDRGRQAPPRRHDRGVHEAHRHPSHSRD
ncbi:GDP-mannose-dependent alpha-(1-6)-phosphatidylinositol monomannoside mannosyltransferase [Aquisphaera giovannonii]|uniref:GDP-mannose-dependent alpha-(1-6)-phosphatidylinositol monomannoside mannosyltransferase n=1 Tax=Aquisphaera giovannonii TaxID=406548 RepID=A0A5B9W274_9BACT|nr:glycosyltransferase family 4 protein [Aquisphaera giovannonii]QEH34221.1 GDP-mannose-dependent alpha-(1-6)-phosphatidylinositol monomannoside mannosyltransferase [Aquisphaera giovannonii]